jgi:hypothetical protein
MITCIGILQLVARCKGYVPTVLDTSLHFILLLSSLSVFKVIAVSMGARGSVVVKTLCYKPEGRGFDSR